MSQQPAVPLTASTQRTSTGDKLNPKKLIIACDGTWQKADSKGQNPTNVTRLARAVSSHDTLNHQQIVYYQAGVGTGLGLLNHLWGGATGFGLGENIQQAYAFLTLNYDGADPTAGRQHADSIFLIGFSRGAFTARSVGGLLSAIGLLTKPALPYLYHILQDWEHAGKKGYKPIFWAAWNHDHKDEDQLVGPTHTFVSKKPELKDIDEYMALYKDALMSQGLTQDVRIQAIGVFDTVGSLGIPVNPLFQYFLPFLPNYFREYAFFDTRIGSNVRVGFQALALDERRAPYQPAIWEDQDFPKAPRIKQTWFPGAHSNIGGGYSQTGISDLSLAWMMDHLSGHGDGYINPDPEDPKNAMDWIQFDDETLDNLFTARKVRDAREYELDGTGPSFRKWGQGFIYDSFNFPQSVLGSRVRSPGYHHATNFENGRKEGRILKPTNEYIHRSVRLRLKNEGRAPEPQWSQAFPHSVNIFPWIKQAWYGLTGKLIGRKSLNGEPVHRFWPVYNPVKKGGALESFQVEHPPASEIVVDNGTQPSQPNGHVARDQSGQVAEEVPTRTAVRWQALHEAKRGIFRREVIPIRSLPEDQLGKYETKLWILEHERGEPLKARSTNVFSMIWRQITRNLRRAKAM